MSEVPYNNRELDHFLGDMKDQLNRIETQVLKTNGRVNLAELNISTVNTKINTTIWAFGITLPVILALGGVVFYAELQALRTAIPNEDEVRSAIRAELIDYKPIVYEEN